MSKKRTEYSESFKAEAFGKIKENAGNVSQRVGHTHEHACELVSISQRWATKRYG